MDIRYLNAWNALGDLPHRHTTLAYAHKADADGFLAR